MNDTALTTAGLARPLRRPEDLDPLDERIGGARYVLLGEASHGMHEYYRWRAEITKRLVEERGFSFVAVEGDWPDCFAINAWVRGLDGDGRDAEQVLAGFTRWPTWMWANQEVAAMVSWMRTHNDGRPPAGQVGFYGFDVYSLWESMRAVLEYLDEHEPGAVETAKQAFRCFEPYREDPQAYARATQVGPTSCEDEVVALLTASARRRLASGAGSASWCGSATRRTAWSSSASAGATTSRPFSAPATTRSATSTGPRHCVPSVPRRRRPPMRRSRRSRSPYDGAHTSPHGGRTGLLAGASLVS